MIFWRSYYDLFWGEKKDQFHSSISGKLLALLENITMSDLHGRLTLFDISLKRSFKILALMMER